MKDDTKEVLAGRLRQLAQYVGRNKYILVLLAAGLLLLLWPAGKTEKAAAAVRETGEPAFSLEAQEEKLAGLLTRVDGAGRVAVMLTLKTGAERVVAMETERQEREAGEETTREMSEKPAVVSAASAVDDAVTLRYEYPVYQGAVVVAEGADSGSVRLALTEATAALTGLPSSHIKVIKMK